MRKWNVLAAILAVAFVVPTSFAQTQEDILQDLTALKSRVAKLETENAVLKSSVADQNAQELESQISALTDRYMQSAGTTVKSAANPVTLSGEFRFRNSWSFGDNAGGGEHDGSWTDALVRLGFQYDFTRDVTAYAELQSDWAFGDGTAATNDNSGSAGGVDFSTYQAWLEVRNLFDRPEFSTRTGRQEIVLGNQFQFGNADWYNGFSFDGTRWDWDSESFSLTGLVLKLSSSDGDGNQLTSFQNAHDNDELYSLYFTLKTISNHTLDLYWIYVDGHGGGAQGTGANNGGNDNGVADEYWHTLGGRLGGTLPDVAAGLDWNAEVAYQFGDGSSDVDAVAFEAELGVTFNAENAFRVYARFLFAEGADDGDAAYQTLFPNRHSNSGFRARYGIADLIPMSDVISIQGGLHFSPAENWTMGATVVWAGVDEGSLAGTNDDDDDYGLELDFWAEHTYSANLSYGIGLAFVFPDDGIEALSGTDDDTQFIGYIQARLVF
ncbi:MAG: alginate export family protein [Planctomycetes bacterium]|nr:alginate export family protein [Planctomycetota bacterium]